MSDWCADYTFAVHAYKKILMGVVLIMGKVSIQNISMKQKINIKSSREAELVAANDVLSHFLWTNIFLNQQGYDCNPTFYQDNTSSILLETT